MPNTNEGPKWTNQLDHPPEYSFAIFHCHALLLPLLLPLVPPLVIVAVHVAVHVPVPVRVLVRVPVQVRVRVPVRTPVQISVTKSKNKITTLTMQKQKSTVFLKFSPEIYWTYWTFSGQCCYLCVHKSKHVYAYQSHEASRHVT